MSVEFPTVKEVLALLQTGELSPTRLYTLMKGKLVADGMQLSESDDGEIEQYDFSRTDGYNVDQVSFVFHFDGRIVYTNVFGIEEGEAESRELTLNEAIVKIFSGRWTGSVPTEQQKNSSDSLTSTTPEPISTNNS